MAKKTPEEKASIIAKKTFDAMWRGFKVPSVDDLLRLSESKRISHLYKFKMPHSITPDQFEDMIARTFQVILDRVYGRGLLQAHVKIKYTETVDAGAHYLGILPGQPMTSWYVTKS